MSTITIDDLREIKLIGRGRYGSVMLCIHDQSQIYFAVKNIDYDRMEANYVYREISNSLTVGIHPGIVQFYYHDTRTGAGEMQRTRIVLEYCKGGDIHESVIKRKPELSLEVRRKWLKQMAEALQFLHSKGIVHRDFKAENILLTDTVLEQADAKLCDLGISKNIDSQNRALTPGIGTYYAPEQFSTNYDEKVDVWALGILAHELFTFAHPFTFRDIEELKELHSRLRLQPFAAPSVHPALSDFIRLCLSYFPQQRPSAGELLSHSFFTVDLVVPPDPVPPVPRSEPYELISRDLQQAESQLQHIAYLREAFDPDFARALATNYRAYLGNQLALIQRLGIPQSAQWFTALNDIKARLNALIG